jgi:hypothetical protein
MKFLYSAPHWPRLPLLKSVGGTWNGRLPLQVHGEKAERTLHLLAMILDHAHGRNMPILRPHHAAARGLPFRLALVPSSPVPLAAWPQEGVFEVAERVPPTTTLDVATHSAVVRFTIYLTSVDRHQS